MVEKNTVITYFYRSSIVCSATTPHPSSPEEGTTLGARKWLPTLARDSPPSEGWGEGL